MGISRFDRVGLTAALLALGGCSAPQRDVIKPQAEGSVPQAALVAQPLVTHEVHAPEARAAFLRRYAEETGLSVSSEGGVTKVGPLLSFFEASWLAGLVPGGAVVRPEAYDEPASPAPFAKLREAAGRVPTYVGTRRVAGERFALVTWDGDGPDKQQELYQTNARGPRFLAKLPSKASVAVSSGLLFTKVGDEGTVLQIVNDSGTDRAKAERLVAWRFALGARETLFDLPFFSLELPPAPVPEPETAERKEPKATAPKATEPKAKTDEVIRVLRAEVTRVKPEDVGVRVTSYRVTLRPLEGSEGVSLALNDWSDERWKDKEKPDLVEIVKVEPTGERTSSLE